MQQGDRNTSFFHQFAMARRKRNLIKKLKHNDDWVEGTEALKPLILQYFTNLFSSEVHDTDAALMDKIHPKVTEYECKIVGSLLSRGCQKGCV
jgi:hypothetical protein